MVSIYQRDVQYNNMYTLSATYIIETDYNYENSKRTLKTRSYF